MLAAIPNKLRLNVDDFMVLPESTTRVELIEGELHMAPSPLRFHQDIAFNLVAVLADYLREHPIGKVYFAPLDVVLTEHNVFQPDVLFIRNENLNLLTKHGVEGGPDLVVEILSSSTARLDLGPKRKIYAQTGVEELWIIDPEKKRVSIYRLRQDASKPQATCGAKGTFQTELLPGLVFSCSELFKS